jgi:hypothetical protein
VRMCVYVHMHTHTHTHTYTHAHTGRLSSLEQGMVRRFLQDAREAWTLAGGCARLKMSQVCKR